MPVMFNFGYTLGENKALKTHNRALEAQEQRRKEAEAWEERRRNAVGLSMLPRPDRVTMLDMAYLSGKIYEDPQADPAFTCDLPDGKSLYQGCSDMLKMWYQERRIFTDEIYTDGQKKIKDELEKKIQDNKIKKLSIGFVAPMAGPDSRAMPPELIKKLNEDVKNEKEILDAEIRKDSEKLKEISINSDKTYFKAALYVHPTYRCSVLVIRGTVTDEWETLLADLGYGFNKNFYIRSMYEQAKKFYSDIAFSNDFVIRENPIVAVTGHSLGGIIAKMIAPITGLSTYTFNSPGVKQYLKEKNLPNGLGFSQEIITFYAKGDAIGNFRRDNDFGTHIPLSVKGFSEEIDYTGINKILKDGLDHLNKTRTMYHGMNLMFQHLNENEEGRKYVTKGIKYEN